MADTSQPAPKKQQVIFVASIFHKGLGKRIFAADYGKRAFRLVIRKKQ